ncbi:hypothetical protein H310_05912 [Aphanomyces invadans]|uniref:Transmembrane protein 198 n=1 Tax=Aphanomyces invadans TaxID=157072 RepID=A0A024U9Z4_9STRA|nr:hypothetical protein H310_05912 [Aphanomyces invadans]ETW02393.1 hypothetical protein H310_05912 [Aphanomyces invadans]|eukprot:XP_008868998.1 hypothetical protein H310_05912 [Aphanomyces invadans]
MTTGLTRLEISLTVAVLVTAFIGTSFAAATTTSAPSITVAALPNLTDGSSDFDRAANDLLASGSKISFAPGVVAGLAIGVGSVVALFGYKLFRPVLFVCGFAVGSVVFYLIAEKIFANQTYMVTAAWICFVAGGLVVGTTVMCIWKLGVFIVGAAAGVLLAFIVNNTVGYKLWPSNPSGMLYILIVGLGILGGLLARCLERPFLIIATSFFGATAVVWGVGYFAGKYPSGSDLEALRVQLADGSFVYSISAAWWAYLAATVGLFFIAMYMQFSKTAWGLHHDHRSNSQQRSHAAPARAYQTNATPTVGEPALHVAPY